MSKSEYLFIIGFSYCQKMEPGFSRLELKAKKWDKMRNYWQNVGEQNGNTMGISENLAAPPTLCQKKKKKSSSGH